VRRASYLIPGPGDAVTTSDQLKTRSGSLAESRFFVGAAVPTFLSHAFLLMRIINGGRVGSGWRLRDVRLALLI